MEIVKRGREHHKWLAFVLDGWGCHGPMSVPELMERSMHSLRHLEEASRSCSQGSGRAVKIIIADLAVLARPGTGSRCVRRLSTGEKDTKVDVSEELR